MTFYFFIYFLCLDFVSSFPLKECDLDEKEFLFTIDCRDEVKAQIEFIQQTEKYLRNDKNWKNLTFSYMTFRNKSLQTLKNSEVNISFEDVLTIVNKCDQVISISDIFRTTNVFFERQLNILKIAFIFLSKLYESDSQPILKIIEKQDKDTTKLRYFLIKMYENTTNVATNKGNYIYATKSFLGLNATSVFNKVCDFKCTESSIQYVDHLGERSFYHVHFMDRSWYTQVKKECRSRFNSYVLSLESFEEFIFLSSEVSKLEFFKKHNTAFKSFLGLEKEWKNWQSGNSLSFSLSSQNLRPDSVFSISFNWNKNNTDFATQNSTIWDYVRQESIYNIVRHVLVVCECHTVIPMDTSLHSKSHKDILTSAIVLDDDLFGIINFMLEEGNDFSDDSVYYEQLSCKNNSIGGYIHILCRYDYNLHLLLYASAIFRSYGVLASCNNCDMNGLHQSINQRSHHNDTCSAAKIANSCSVNSALLNNPLTFTTCNNVSVATCIKCDHNIECIQDCHLGNCNHFICPSNYIKCPESYCISPSKVNNRVFDCPSGYDERLYAHDNQVCKAYIKMTLKQICVDKTVLDDLSQNYSHSRYVCHELCPPDYNCVSSKKLTSSNDNTYYITIRQANISLYNISNKLHPEPSFTLYLPLLDIIEFHGKNCRLKTLSQAFGNWDYSKIMVLDLSHNLLVNIDNNFLLPKLTNLMHLNLSFNVNLKITKELDFPSLLEVLDLSHTDIEALRMHTFVHLIHLKHLNLSFTHISTFKNLGIPEYFILETLDLRGVTFSDIQNDFFHGLSVKFGIWLSNYKLCCPQIVNPNISQEKCHSPEDIISSCKHLVGDILKRVVIWVIGFVTLVGNGVVLVFRLMWNRDIVHKAYGLFITGLAISDFIMGIYLTIIAITDIYYRDFYVLEDVHWRSGSLCQLAGFLSTLSSETSTCFICLITLERFLSVKFPFGEHRFSRVGKMTSFILSWVIGTVLAITPMTSPNWHIYSSNGLCLALPLSAERHDGWQFSVAVFIVLNFILFLLIASGQLVIFFSVTTTQTSILSSVQSSQRRSQEITIAKKLALVAMSDFMCWFPISIMGIFSLNGHTFSSDTYAWLAIFVLPVNSALNPIIYTIPAIARKCN